MEHTKDETRDLFEELRKRTSKELEWGTKIDFNLGWTPVEDRDIWCGELNDEVGLEIIGDEKSPDPKLMESALNIIDELDRYLTQIPFTLGDGEDEWQLLSVNFPNKDDADEFELELISYYGAGIDFLFRNGRIVREENHFDKLKRLIEKNLNINNCKDIDDIKFFSDIENYNYKVFQTLLFRYLNRFPEDDLFTILSEVWGNDVVRLPGSVICLNELKIKTSSVLKDQKIRCRQCGSCVETDLLFNFGDCINYPEYRLNEEVRWGDINHGEKESETIYISAISPYNCRCGSEVSTLIECKENMLSRVCDDLAANVEYGPWLGKSYITEKLIFLDDYKRIKSRQLFLKMEERKGYKSNRIIDKSMELSAKHTMGSYPGKTEAYSYFTNRELFSEMEKENLDDFFRFKFHNQKVKSACILKDVTFFCKNCNSDITSDFWFHWGTLLDFPEYKIGEKIKWSDYSMGSESEKIVFAIGNSIFSHGHCREFQVLIEIRESKIIGAEYLDSYHHKIKALTGEERKSFLLWPDNEFVY